MAGGQSASLWHAVQKAGYGNLWVCEEGECAVLENRPDR